MADDDTEHMPPVGELNEHLFKTRGTGGFFPRRYFDEVVFDEDGVPELDELDLANIAPDATIVNFGSRRTGKSTLTRHLCYHHLQEFFPRGIVYSDTDELNKHYAAYFPERYIHPGLDDEVQSSVLNFQKSLKKDPDHEERLAKDPNYNRIITIYDDVINDNTLRHSKPLSTAFTNGRHYEMCLILSTQYPKAINPQMRDNVDAAFMFAQSTMGSSLHLHECFGGYMTRPLFLALLDKYTEDHRALVFININKSEKRLKYKYFWIKADKEVPPFRMGSDAFWQEDVRDEEDKDFEAEGGRDPDGYQPYYYRKQ